MSDSGSETKLARNAIGLADVLFQSITSMAPAAAIAASIPLGAAFAGGALPLAVVIAFVGILFTAWSIGQLASHIPAAGSVATYTAVGLSPKVGFLVGWGYAAVEVLIVPLVMLQLGFTLGGELTSMIPAITAGSWWIFMAIGTILVCGLVYRGVKTSTETGVWLGAIEIAVFLILGIVLVIKAGNANTLAVFTPHFANAKGFEGWSGVFAGAVGALLAFSGFEAAAPLAEETKNPRRNIPIAIMGATVAIGALYIFTTYAAAVSFGPEKFVGFATWNNGVPWDGLAHGVSVVFWALVLFAIVNSTLANANSGANVFTRTAYAMGRIGVFPLLRPSAPQVQVAAVRGSRRADPGPRARARARDSGRTRSPPSASSRRGSSSSWCRSTCSRTSRASGSSRGTARRSSTGSSTSSCRSLVCCSWFPAS